MLCSDVTPLQLDEMAREYEHRLDRTGLVRWAKFRWNRRVMQRAAAPTPRGHGGSRDSVPTSEATRSIHGESR